jgi:hypothetical protein
MNKSFPLEAGAAEFASGLPAEAPSYARVPRPIELLRASEHVDPSAVGRLSAASRRQEPGRRRCPSRHRRAW